VIEAPDEVDWVKLSPHPDDGDYCDLAALRIPDDAVDLLFAAGYRWAPRGMLFDESVLGDDPNVGVGVGDEVVAIGLLTVHYGKDRNEPVLRTGNLAMLPSEPVLVKYKSGVNRRMRLYLTELRSISGLSGSPVFVRHRSQIGAPTATVSLLGVMIGHWDDPDANHMGFGKVVPAKMIAKLLDQEAEVKKRKEIQKQREASGGQAEADTSLGKTEFERFENLTRELANTPKPKADEDREQDR
jgi:hypothetical protein